MVVVIFGFTCASLILHTSINDWMESPGKVKQNTHARNITIIMTPKLSHPQVTINSFSVPVTELPFPAITICKSGSGDAGDYVRAIYNNFQFKCNSPASCESRKLLGDHFYGYANKEFLQRKVLLLSFCLNSLTFNSFLFV